MKGGEAMEIILTKLEVYGFKYTHTETLLDIFMFIRPKMNYFPSM